MTRPFGWKTTLRFGDPRPNTPEYPQDGKLFHGYQQVPNGIREGWVTPETLEQIRSRAKARARDRAVAAGRKFIPKGPIRRRRQQTIDTARRSGTGSPNNSAQHA